MKQVNEHIDDLIIQFLCGELDENSLAELRAWIAISPQNERNLVLICRLCIIKKI